MKHLLTANAHLVKVTYRPSLIKALLFLIMGLTFISPARAVAVMSLNEIDGSNGFRMDGVWPNGEFGHLSQSSGDVNGDGLGDLLVACPRAGIMVDGEVPGSAYVVFGTDTITSASFLADTLDGKNGFEIKGVLPDENLGLGSGSGFGDINGDGLDDIILGASYSDSNGERAGTVHVIFGKSDWSTSATIETSLLNGNNGFTLIGETGSGAGSAAFSQGDINKDGIDDLFIAAPAAGHNGTNSGSVFVVFGKADWSQTPLFELSGLDGTNGFRVDGSAAYDWLYHAVLEELNGDTFPELVVGTNSLLSRNRQGGVYVIYGRADWSATPNISVSTISGSVGFRITPVEDNDKLYGQSTLKDLNNDGYNELMLTNEKVTSQGLRLAGSYIVLYGRPNWTASLPIDITAIEPDDGFYIDTDKPELGVGLGDDVGDVNGDGYLDLLLGNRNMDHNGSYSGSSYVIYGKQDWSGTTRFNLSDLDGINGFRIDGATYGDHAGTVSELGDFNGDGIDDFVIGATRTRFADRNYDNYGSCYVIYGRAANSGFADELWRKY